MEDSEAVRTAMEEGRCLFATVDTWTIWVSTVCVCVCVCEGVNEVCDVCM